MDNSSNNFAQLLEQQIASALDTTVQTLVQQQLGQLTSDPTWAPKIETLVNQNIAQHVLECVGQIDTDAVIANELDSALTRCRSKLMTNFQINGIIDVVEKQIAAVLDTTIQSLVQETLHQLTLDPEWLAKIETLVNQNVTQRVLERISHLDTNAVIAGEIDGALDRWRNKLLANFQTSGITDTANSTQLMVMDGAVVVEQGLAANSLLVEHDAEVQGAITVQNLVVKGTVNTDNRAWNELADVVATQTQAKLSDAWREELAQQVVEAAKTKGIDFGSITVGGQPLVDNGALAIAVKESNLETVGTLRDLTVAGSMKIGNDMLNVGSRRIGINTDSPEMALGLWDEEVSLLAGKFAKNTGYVGTGRAQNLAIGVNRQPQITLDVDGLTSINQLRVDRWRIGHSAVTPGHSGTRGDFLINSDPKPDTPFAWLCLGGFKWQPLWSK